LIIRDFTPTDYQAMVDIHNSLNIVWPERPRTAQAWEEVDQNRNPKHPFRRWVAEEEDRVVGFATYRSSPWEYPPGSFYINVEVNPVYQHRGIGAALYDQVLSALKEFEPPSLRADAFANLPQGFAFLQKRGRA
jgi:L-amino acid N-acyltransferase YncA